MKENPTQYMLDLAKQGAKIPSKFDFDTLREQPFGDMDSITQESITTTLAQGATQPLVQPTSLILPSQSLATSLVIQLGTNLGITPNL